MSNGRPAFLFPGQGAYFPAVLRDVWDDYAEIDDTFTQIDAVLAESGGVSVRALLRDGEPRTIESLLESSATELQLCFYGTATALFRVIHGRGIEPGILLGHSLGEIVALTAGGRYTVEDGARIVQARTEALNSVVRPAAGMVALGVNAEVAAALVRAVDDPMITVAAKNAPRQTVVSGPTAALAKIIAAAQALGISSSTLKSPHPFHSSLLAVAVEPFRASIAGLRQQPMRYPVYSPILGRFYSDDDDVAGLLARHLVMPVDFLAAVRYAHDLGASIFVECGARDALTGLVRRILPNADTIACLDGRTAGAVSIELATSRLLAAATSGVLPRPTPAVPTAVATRPAPPVEPREPSPPPVVATAVPTVATTSRTRTEVLAQLRATYADALEYPEEVFVDDADLEADLGIDSVKQTELLARVAETYQLPQLPADFRLADYTTLGDIADLVIRTGTAANVPEKPSRPTAGPAPMAPAAVPEPILPTAGPAPVRSRTEVLAQLRATYADALEYPEEVFVDDADLEADLGIDSVKQTELLARVAETYQLPQLPADFRLADYTTLGDIADLIMRPAAVAA